MSTHSTPHETEMCSESTPESTMESTVVRVERTRGGRPRGGRADRVVSWLGWHLGELAAVGVPAALAVTVHPVWGVLAAVVAAGWVTHEVRQSRRRAAASTTGPVTRPAVRPVAAAPTGPVGPAVGAEENVAGEDVADREVRRGSA